MAQVMVGIRPEAHKKLRRLSRRKRVSMQGLLSALVEMACGEDELGIIDLDWDAIKKKYPNNKTIAKKRWAIVVECVRALMEDTDDPSEMAARSRFTRAQCERAMKEIIG